MKRLHFGDYGELACDISDKFDEVKDRHGDISFIAKYEEAKEVIKELICIGFDIASLNMEREEFGYYHDEYCVDLNEDGIWAEPIKRKDYEYIDNDADVVYIMDNCSSSVVKHCSGTFVYEVSVGCDEGDECTECQESDNDTNNSESTYVSRDKDGRPVGFSKSWSTVSDGFNYYSSYSHYSNNLNMMRNIAESFGVKL